MVKRSWFQFLQRQEIFLFSKIFRLVLKATQPLIQWFMGLLPLGVELPGQEADHSPPYSDKIKIQSSYTSTSPTPPMFLQESSHEDVIVLCGKKYWT
jgi:hypothetical protein